ncbi:hypothetical protein MT418_007396 [Batrachochytrium dendrobatidis]
MECMEVDSTGSGIPENSTRTDSSENVVACIPSSSGLSITLHPLVILNISDHHTRIRMQTENTDSSIALHQVIGALIGIQIGREVEILNSFELPCTLVDGQTIVDMSYFSFKQDQYKQVYPTMDFLGWYSTGMTPTQSEIYIHQQMCQHNDAPLFLQMHFIPSDVPAIELPITFYESLVDIVDGVPHTLFVKSKFKIETSDEELLAIEHVAHETSEEGQSKLTTHLIGQQNAICMLQSRVKALVQYMQDVEHGVLPKNHTLLRQISSLCNRLPTLQGNDFDNEFNVDYNDVLVMTLLAALTKGSHSLNELTNKINTIRTKRALHRPSTGSSGVAFGQSAGTLGMHI